MGFIRGAREETGLLYKVRLSLRPNPKGYLGGGESFEVQGCSGKTTQSYWVGSEYSTCIVWFNVIRENGDLTPGTVIVNIV